MYMCTYTFLISHLFSYQERAAHQTVEFSEHRDRALLGMGNFSAMTDTWQELNKYSWNKSTYLDCFSRSVLLQKITVDNLIESQ